MTVVWASHLEEVGRQLVSTGATALVKAHTDQEVKDALLAFNNSLLLCPALKGQVWQRAFALYFLGRYQEAGEEWATNLKFDPTDCEHLLWKFVCDVRTVGLAAARSSLLSASHRANDRRLGMMQIMELFTGDGTSTTVDEVLSSVPPPPSPSSAYAHLYCGLYCQYVKGDLDLAEGHLHQAATTPSPDWMGHMMKRYYYHHFVKERKRALVPVVTMIKLGFSTTRVIQGGWQMSEGHHQCDEGSDGDDRDPSTRAVDNMRLHAEAGITTVDCGDIYSGVEELIGSLVREYKDKEVEGTTEPPLRVHTKLVPDLDQLSSVDDTYVRQAIRRSLNRLGLSCLYLVQFHWWDFSVPGYLSVLQSLAQLQEEGLVQHVGVTNFDVKHLQEVRAVGGARVVANQVQVSIVDRRAHSSGLLEYCKKEGVAVLAYGVLAGGFLTDGWMGKPEPSIESLPTRSLVKYKLVIEEWGGWERFQKLLRAMREVADGKRGPGGRGATIAQVAIRYVLDRMDGVTAAIIGSRNSSHLDETVEAVASSSSSWLRLSEEDYRRLEGVCSEARGVPGEVYELERDREGRHGSIMRYNLNRVGGADHLEECIRRYIHDHHFYFHPQEATKAGVHSESQLSRHERSCHSFLSELNSLDRLSMTEEQERQLDWAVSCLQLELMDIQRGRQDPAILLSKCFDAITVLMDGRCTDTLSSEERRAALRHRLARLVPALLKDSRQQSQGQSARSPPAAWLCSVAQSIIEAYVRTSGEEEEDLMGKAVTPVALACQLSASYSELDALAEEVRLEEEEEVEEKGVAGKESEEGEGGVDAGEIDIERHWEEVMKEGEAGQHEQEDEEVEVKKGKAKSKGSMRKYLKRIKRALLELVDPTSDITGGLSPRGAYDKNLDLSIHSYTSTSSNDSNVKDPYHFVMIPGGGGLVPVAGKMPLDVQVQ